MRSWSLVGGSLALLAGACLWSGGGVALPPRAGSSTVAPAARVAPRAVSPDVESAVLPAKEPSLAEPPPPVDPVGELEAALGWAEDPSPQATRRLAALFLSTRAPLVRAACADALARRELPEGLAFELATAQRGRPSE